MDYEQWSIALAERFFVPGTDGPVFLFTDDDALAELHPSGDPTAARESLATAVRSHLSPGGDLFLQLRRKHKAWRGGSKSGPPPCLPLLALSVNAATQMHAEGTYATHNYYIRLRDLLGLPRHGGEPDGFGAAMRLMWPDLDRWLEEHERQSRGRSTIRDHPRLRYIGYSLSQALWRRSDTVRLGRLFQALDLPAFSNWDVQEPPLTKRELRIHFGIWAATAQGFSPGARRLAVAPEYGDLLEDVLWAALSSWPGHLLKGGVPIARLIPSIVPFPWVQFRFWAERRPGMPGTLTLSNGSVLSAGSDEWYEGTPIALEPSDLISGKTIAVTGEGQDFVLDYEAAQVVPFREDSTLAEWAAVQRVAPNQRHWVLVSRYLVGALEAYLGTFAESGWRVVAPPTGFDSWALYRDVEIDTTAPLDSFPEFWRLRPADRLSLAFHGGLRLSDYVGNVYLESGPPDLWIPPGVIGGAGDAVVVDGVAYVGPGPEGGRFRLSGLGLTEGPHEVAAGERRVAFHLLRTGQRMAHASAGTAGFAFDVGEPPRLRHWRVGSLPKDDPRAITISGGVIRGPMPELTHRPVSARYRAQETLILGATPGQISRPTEPAEPPWLAKTGLDPSRFDFAPPFEAVWVLQRFGQSRWLVLCCLPDMGPAIQRGDRTRSVDDWAGALAANRSLVERAAPVGGAYVAEALRILGADDS